VVRDACKARLDTPAWVFPLAWNVLYALMAISLWRLWQRSRQQIPGSSGAITLFLTQLALNATWSPVFFGLHAIRSGFVIILTLALVLALTIAAARPVDRLATWLLMPYLAWILYAASLNGAIVLMN